MTNENESNKMTANTHLTNGADNKNEDLTPGNKKQVCSVSLAEAMGDPLLRELHLHVSKIFQSLGEPARSAVSHHLFLPRAQLAPEWTIEDFLVQFKLDNPHLGSVPTEALLPMVEQSKDLPRRYMYEADCDYCAVEMPKELLGREEIDFDSIDLSCSDREPMRCRVYRIFFADATHAGRPFRGTILGYPTHPANPACPCRTSWNSPRKVDSGSVLLVG